eukprot:m.259084 g.259084  ORF g.259084 m.259084 type:complete len:383 (+) comp19657_c0_seq1:61-1209(+)
MNMDAFVKACEAAAMQGAEYLEKELLPVVGPGGTGDIGIGDTYKAIYALALTGRHRSANIILDFVCKKFEQAPGVYTPDPTPTTEPSFALIMRWYKSAVCLMGAASLARWDVCSPAALATLASKITPMNDTPSAGGIGFNNLLAVTPSAMCGLVFIHRGMMQSARMLADFLVKVWHLQPSDAQFHMLYDTDTGALVQDNAATPPWLKQRKVLYCVDAAKERQHNYAPGVAAAFLAEAFQALGNKEYLEVSKKLMEFDQRCSWTGAFKQWPSKCKAAWGAALVARACHAVGDACDDVATHCKNVAQSCFLDNLDGATGSFGVYHFPLGDAVVDHLDPGTVHWEDNASKGVVDGDSYKVGTEQELTAEFVYELQICVRGLAFLQ